MNWGAFLLAMGTGVTVSSLCALNGFDVYPDLPKAYSALAFAGIVVAAIGAGLLAG